VSALPERPLVKALVARLSPFRILGRTSRGFRAAVVAASFSLLAAVDLLMRPDVSFLTFYFLPVLLASWYLGPREGLAVSLASVSVFIADDILTSRSYASAAVPLWNHGAELAFFVFFSWLVGTLHAAFEREAQARTERLEHDVAVAGEVQAALMPSRRLQAGPFAGAAECRQAFGVGGDAWDLVALPGGAVFAAVADVSGKGIPAALLSAGFLGSLRAQLATGAARLDALAAALSESLRTASADRRFVTAFLAVAEDGRIRYVNAGHEPALLLAADGTLNFLPSTGPVLGLLPGARYREAGAPFPAAASLVLYTDGLTECEGPDGSELGRSGVAAVAARLAGMAPEEVVARLLSAVEAHSGGAPPGDDVTVLCLSRRAP
jgi:phosphoserine phosphatase RsbU/P